MKIKILLVLLVVMAIPATVMACDGCYYFCHCIDLDCVPAPTSLQPVNTSAPVQGTDMGGTADSSGCGVDYSGLIPSECGPPLSGSVC